MLAPPNSVFGIFFAWVCFRFSNTLETVVLIVAALGFLNIVDTVVRWFAGG